MDACVLCARAQWQYLFCHLPLRWGADIEHVQQAFGRREADHRQREHDGLPRFECIIPIPTPGEVNSVLERNVAERLQFCGVCLIHVYCVLCIVCVCFFLGGGGGGGGGLRTGVEVCCTRLCSLQ